MFFVNFVANIPIIYSFSYLLQENVIIELIRNRAA